MSTVPTSLVSVTSLVPGDGFVVPALAAGPASWWTVDRLVALPGSWVRVVMGESDRRGRPYRVVIHEDDRVVWSVRPCRVLVPGRLGHHVWCNSCGRPWGWLPVSTSNTPCYPCARRARVGI